MIIGAYPPDLQRGFDPIDGVEIVDEDLDGWDLDRQDVILGPRVSGPHASPKDAAQTILAHLDHHGPLSFAVPLCEEAVLPCAWANTYFSRDRPGPGLRLDRAAATVSRLRLRQVLPSRLSPAWLPWSHGEKVDWRFVESELGFPLLIKQPASMLSQGVVIAADEGAAQTFLSSWRENDRVHAMGAFDIRTPWILEEHISALQWEVNGWILGEGDDAWTSGLTIIRHHWEGTRIASYAPEPDPPSGLLIAAIDALRELGLNDCGYNLEFRGPVPPDDRFVVIDAHARLGEEVPSRPDAGDYHRLLHPSGFPVAALLLDLVTEGVRMR